jgi:hydroxyethylthiazole kinase
LRRLQLASQERLGFWTPSPLEPCGFERQVATGPLEHRPAIIRGNASEILALSGFAGGGKGVDSTDDPTAAMPFARELAKRTGAVIAISGILEYITDRSDVISIAGGNAIMTASVQRTAHPACFWIAS